MYQRGLLLFFYMSATAATVLAQQADPAPRLVTVQPSYKSSPAAEQPPQVAPKTGPLLEQLLPAPIEMTDIDRQLLKLKAQRQALATDQDAAKQQFSPGVSMEGAETAKLRA